MHFGIGLHYILVKKMFCNTQFIRLFIQNGIYSLSFSSKVMKLRLSQQKLLRILRLESSQKTKILFSSNKSSEYFEQIIHPKTFGLSLRRKWK